MRQFYILLFITTTILSFSTSSASASSGFSSSAKEIVIVVQDKPNQKASKKEAAQASDTVHSGATQGRKPHTGYLFPPRKTVSSTDANEGSDANSAEVVNTPRTIGNIVKKVILPVAGLFLLGTLSPMI